MKGEIFNDGVQYEISSDDVVSQAAERSDSKRAPLRDVEVSGTRTLARVRPYWVDLAIARINELRQVLKNLRDWRYSSMKDASVVAGSFLLYFTILFIVSSDGLLIGPVISNAIDTFESDVLRLAVGLAVAGILSTGGWAVAIMMRLFVPGRFGQPIAILLSGILGAVAGYYIGSAGDGTQAGMMLRGILTACSLMAMAAVHFALVSARNAWGQVRIATKLLREAEAEMKSAVAQVTAYQEKRIEELQEHNRSEVSRHEGLIVGRFAHEKQDIRTSWTSKRFSSWLDKLAGAIVFVTTLSAVADSAWADNKVLVLDTTASIASVTALIEKLVKEIPLNYGDTIIAYTINSMGLNFAFSGKVKKVSQPGHRQSLEKVKEDLISALKAAANTGDNDSSPIIDSLLTLAVDLRPHVDQGENFTVVVASDFMSNTDKNKTQGQPFAGVDVIAVLPDAGGKEVKKHQGALDLAKKIFSGARSIHWVQ